MYKFDIELCDHGYRQAFPPCTSCTPNTVNVILGFCGDIMIDDKIHSRDIQTSAKTKTQMCDVVVLST